MIQRAHFAAIKCGGFEIKKSNFSSSQDSIPLVILRHGQSTWNQQNIFIGMTDTPLTEDGIKEARTAGNLLLSEERARKPEMVFTSLLRRSTKTVWHVMEELGREWVPVHRDWRLNERSYGALVGRNKKQCVEEFGKDQVKRWRRSWDEPPPPMSKASEFWPGKDLRYKALGVDLESLPLSESLKDVTSRTSQFWDEEIIPQLKLRKRILIVGHENNLRSIIKRLDNISNEDILNIELPRAIPILYELSPDTFKPLKLKDAAQGLSGRYLCPKDILDGIHLRDQHQVYNLAIKSTLETAPFYGLTSLEESTKLNLEVSRRQEE